MTLAKLFSCTGEQEAVIQIICHLMGIDRTAVFLLRDLDESLVDEICLYLEKYQAGTPLAYLFGYTYFFNRKFFVNRNVLIPRYDTEVLVEVANKHIIADSVLDGQYPYKILDLCCGSGAIGLALSAVTDWLELKDPHKYYEITLADVSPKALAVAKRNANAQGVDVHLVESDLFANINKKYNLIVCNPPYVRTADIGVEDPYVLAEPRLALDGGLDGLYYYRRILATAHSHLKKGGTLILEIGYDQAKAVEQIAAQNKFNHCKVFQDLGGRDRVVVVW